MFYYFCKVLVIAALRVAFRMKYEGRDNIPKDSPVIYASNHRTNADPPVVGSGARGRCVFMAKEELFQGNILFKWLIQALGAFPVSRGKGDSATLDTAVEKLTGGRSLTIFPEGTRSKDGKVHRGHSGAAVIAVRANKPIIPVGVVFGEKLKFRTPVTVKYGKPIDPAEYIEDFENPNPRQLVKLKNRYMADIKQLVEGDAAAADDKKEGGNE